MPVKVERTCDICGEQAHYDYDVRGLQVAPHGGVEPGGSMSHLTLCGVHFKGYLDACKNWFYAQTLEEKSHGHA